VAVYLSIRASLQSGPRFLLKLNGTALPSLALENLQELENLKLSGPERDKTEDMIAGALASMYSGQYLLWFLEDLVYIVP
jgi:hypothetical protein